MTRSRVASLASNEPLSNSSELSTESSGTQRAIRGENHVPRRLIKRERSPTHFIHHNVSTTTISDDPDNSILPSNAIQHATAWARRVKEEAKRQAARNEQKLLEAEERMARYRRERNDFLSQLRREQIIRGEVWKELEQERSQRKQVEKRLGEETEMARRYLEFARAHQERGESFKTMYEEYKEKYEKRKKKMDRSKQRKGILSGKVNELAALLGC
ncbi:hypothetical protein M231_07589 [Tremella mesenterica]|uniref:Uncharacterized protein n=1 Tax=Tremella mesenterica TaxID=5217 RepID=A0A4Q1BFI7_TREME|nr:hypothetical protein M231_07589 [Tremella mesenterica]